MSTPVRVGPSPATSSFSTVCGPDGEARLVGPTGTAPVPRPAENHSARRSKVRPAAQKEPCRPPALALAYQDGVAGPGGQVDVVGVCRNASITPLDVARYILPDQLDAGADAVGPWPGGGAERGSLAVLAGISALSSSQAHPSPGTAFPPSSCFLPGALAALGTGTYPGCVPHTPARCAQPFSWHPRGSRGCSGDQGGRRGPGPGRSGH